MNVCGRLFGGTLLLAALAAAPAHAQSAIGATYSASAQAAIAEPLSLINTEALNFGAMTVGDFAGGTVTVSPAGVATTTGTITLDNTNVQAGRFTGQGTRRLNRVCLAFGASSITIRRYVGAAIQPEGMTVDNFTIAPIGGTLQAIGGSCGTGSGPRFGIRPPSGSGLFIYAVGARLTVAANQKPGEYRGTYTMTAVYQ